MSGVRFSARLPLVNGALARVVVHGDRREITQELR